MPALPTSNYTHRRTKSDSSELAALNQRRCGLIQCRRTDCNLISHRNFAARCRSFHSSVPSSGAERAIINVRYQPSNGAQEDAILRIERQISDGFPSLSLKRENSNTFRELAHHYFTRQIDRLIRLYSPHLNRRIYKSTMMEHALSSEVFCVCITAGAKVDMLMRGHIDKPDRASEVVYASTAHVLRQKLDNFKHTELDWLLVLVVNLVGFDLAFGRTDSLEAHHQALSQLVRMKGGIHKVGHATPYILNTERFLAIFTGRYPTFSNTPVLPKPLPETPSPNPYGSAFRCSDASDHLDQPVITFCLDQCQLIHLLCLSKISMEPNGPPPVDPSVIPYFLYMRDRLACQGTCLHADYHENQNPRRDHDLDQMYDGCYENSPTTSKSRCVLLAVMIIEYMVMNANYYTVKGPFLASELKMVLESQPPQEWVDSTDMLIWLLFVAVSLVEHWEHREWGMTTLRKQLDVKYGSNWPEKGWKDDMALILKNHVWSDTLELAFGNTCDKLTATNKL